MAAYSFDVAVVPAALPANGRRDISVPAWRRVVVDVPLVLRAPLVEAHLAAAQIVGVHGLVVEVLYRE